MKKEILNELLASKKALEDFINDGNIQSIENSANKMIAALKNGNKIIACGNGGSMSDAMHFASELTGRYQKEREPLAAVAISDPAHITCVANDYGYAYIFSRWIMAHGKKGDVLLAISTSGNSENIFVAVHLAQLRGIDVVFLSGNEGGSVREIMRDEDTEINVPYHGYADKIQEVHIKIIHILCGLIEKDLLNSGHNEK